MTFRRPAWWWRYIFPLWVLMYCTVLICGTAVGVWFYGAVLGHPITRDTWVMAALGPIVGCIASGINIRKIISSITRRRNRGIDQ